MYHSFVVRDELGFVGQPVFRAGRQQAAFDRFADHLEAERMKRVHHRLVRFRQADGVKMAGKLLASQGVEHEHLNGAGAHLVMLHQVLNAVGHGGGLAGTGHRQHAGMAAQGMVDDLFLFGGEGVL